jgi:hypothetical protein
MGAAVKGVVAVVAGAALEIFGEEIPGGAVAGKLLIAYDASALYEATHPLP